MESPAAGVLQQDRAELPRLAQRLERDPKARVDLVDDLLWQILRVDTLLLAGLRRQRLAELLRQTLRIGRMRRDRGERLEVHREVFRRALDPKFGLLLIRERVIGGVILHE